MTDLERASVPLPSRSRPKQPVSEDADEVVAWQTGLQLAGMGGPLARVLTMPVWALEESLEARAVGALHRLGHDHWARWVRQGFEDGKR